MAMAVTFAVQDGMILWETRSGVTTVYVPDHNGNVIECRDNSGNQTYSCEYWPYGEVQTSTGTNPGKFGFGGIVGYVTDSATRLYVRARHYAPVRTSWLTVDAYWPYLHSHTYCSNAPTVNKDPSGRMMIPSMLGVLKAIKCKQLGEILDAALSELKGRYKAMLYDEDPYQYRPNRNPVKPWKGTWDGHQHQYRGWQSRVRNYLKEYQDLNCDDDDMHTFYQRQRECNNWGYKPAPYAPYRPFIANPIPEPRDGDMAGDESGRILIYRDGEWQPRYASGTYLTPSGYFPYFPSSTGLGTPIGEPVFIPVFP